MMLPTNGESLVLSPCLPLFPYLYFLNWDLSEWVWDMENMDRCDFVATMLIDKQDEPDYE